MASCSRRGRRRQDTERGPCVEAPLRDEELRCRVFVTSSGPTGTVSSGAQALEDWQGRSDCPQGLTLCAWHEGVPGGPERLLALRLNSSGTVNFNE
mmetsp:Transcript_55348/g.103846  ORF Transcript_55348/g.103846 Transcript_55348/m.103846 type:complete len:96 (+) Transcript_55348:350-637(+)